MPMGAAGPLTMLDEVQEVEALQHLQSSYIGRSKYFTVHASRHINAWHSLLALIQVPSKPPVINLKTCSQVE